MALQSGFFKLRGRDLNPRPLGYEPNELPAAPPRDAILTGYPRWINCMLPKKAASVKGLTQICAFRELPYLFICVILYCYNNAVL